MPASEYDAIVVGAGPGGSAAAIGLAEKGWKVLLVDKAHFPRDKVCGDFVSPRSLRVLDRLGCREALEQARPRRLTGARLYLNGEQISAGRIPQTGNLPDYGCTLPRFKLDEIIFRRAQAAGVETVEGCEVTEVHTGREGAQVEARHAGETRAFRGRLVIGADGAHSAVARCAGAEARDSKSIIVALRAYYEGVAGDEATADLFFDQRYFPGYAWIFPLGGGRANVGLGMVRDVYQTYQINLREQLDHWLQTDPVARDRLRNARLEGRVVGWPLNTYRAQGGNYFERGLLIGDAASFVDPINGEGIHTALESAGLAAAVADEALRADDLSAAFLARYEQRWRAAFDLDLRTADLIVTIIKNRALTGIWLLVLKMIGEKALTDERYAATCGGILAGVTPTHHSLSPEVVVKTLLHGPGFWRRSLPASAERGVTGLVSGGLLALSAALDAVSDMAQRPAQTVDWGLDVVTKGLGLMARLGEDYAGGRVSTVFDEFFTAWMEQARGRGAPGGGPAPDPCNK
jgi:geranylgeranyl reductase family protein